jgi:hypothetical protein
MGKERQAQIIWNGVKFIPAEDHGVIRNILKDPIYVPRKDGTTSPIYPNEDPEEFMKRLYMQYKGLCRVSVAREIF